MIESFVITNHLGESMTMELRNPDNSGFQVLSVDGLGPSKAEIAVTEMSGQDGADFNSARANTRNVVFRLGFLPKPDIETIRQKSYKYFPLRRPIRIQINATNRQAYVYGYVESNEPDIFSERESCIISVLCPRAHVYDIYEQITNFSSKINLFEFPFSNESLVSPLIEFSEFGTESEKNIVYEGGMPVGIVITIHATGPANDVVMTDSDTLETLSIDSAVLISMTGSDIIAGDEIVISTVKGNKYATLTRSSVDYNILNALGANPTWFEIDRGDNRFAFSADSGLSNLLFEISNEIAYEGI